MNLKSVNDILTPDECCGGAAGSGGMGGVDNNGPLAFVPTCCRDLIREFMYITATERGERRETKGDRRREEGSEG